MPNGELIFVLIIGALLLGGPFVTFVLSIVAYNRSKQIAELSSRLAKLEALVRTLPSSDAASSTIVGNTITPLAGTRSAADEQSRLLPLPMEPVIDLASASTAISPSVSSDEGVLRAELAASESQGWETFVGQKAFGWLAVILFGFSAAFFLRYAFQNNWIGPVGRVAIGEMVGVCLAVAGAFYFRRGLVRFSSMLTAAGVVVLYLSTYSSFGFYQLLPQTHAGIFLAIIVLTSMLAAVIYRSMSVALAATIGGLLTPVLLASAHDDYPAFFSYLAILNVGVVLASAYRRWPGVATVALLGTQGLFWLWYVSQYHPEKFGWVIGFQAVIFSLYLLHGLAKGLRDSVRVDREELGRYVINALLGFAAFHVLMREDYREWLSTGAIMMAVIYAAAANLLLRVPAARQNSSNLQLTSLALCLGFVAWALPLQANTNWYAMSHWIAMGWAIIGLALWLFGLRVDSVPLRFMAGIFGVAAMARLLINDLPFYIREPFVPVFNGLAFPSIIVAACVLYAVLAVGPRLSKMASVEQHLIAIAGVSGVAVLWLVLSVECYGYFVSQSLYGGDVEIWRWRGQLALTVFWTIFATIIMALGFRLDRSRLRWMAITLYAVAVIKLFVVDMANVQQIYRILGFFVLAVVLGLVARAYQRFK
jgi:uncharacterized membrane protein